MSGLVGPAQAICHSAIVSWFPLFKRVSRRKHLFNLDCHISVIADLKQGLRELEDVRLLSWSISNHNFVFRKVFTAPDPVVGINQSTWMEMKDSDVLRFKRRYCRFLASFDGFVITYPTPFVELFAEFGKPLLIVTATRYEFPYSTKSDRWEALDAILRNLISTGAATMVANNQGDADYASHFLQKNVTVFPSVCDYIPRSRSRSHPSLRIFSARSQRLEDLLQSELGDLWLPKEKALGSHYSWKKLLQVEAVLDIPYNISTMTLFELATLGIPVFVPSRLFLEDLAQKFDGVLTELSFFPDQRLAPNDPRKQFLGANPNHPDFNSWWLERADFYNRNLMPNVVQIDSFDDVKLYADFSLLKKTFAESVNERNELLRAERHELLRSFVSQIREDKIPSENTFRHRL